VADTVLVLLAAGRSLRFGDTDKLAAPLDGMPLAFHIVRTLAPMPFAARIAVTSGTALDFGAQGYAVVGNPDPAAGLSRSLAIGIGAARAAGAAAALVILADMPRVGAAHVARLLTLRGPDALAASTDGARPSPPALFGASHFVTLERLTGDAGARALLGAATLVRAAPGELADVDTPEDLARLEA
jgi:molybdenum cofactor cytidylyltransferase